MEDKDVRSCPDYGILENYALENEKYHNLDEEHHNLDKFRKNHIYEIARNNPEVWRVAKEDFELYKYW